MPRISQSEWVIMDVVWDNFPLSARDIIDILKDQTTWNEKTIHTLISRLEKKKVIIADKSTGVKIFSPLLTREQCIKEKTNSLIKNVFGGSKKMLITNFLSECKWTPDEIEELKQLVSKLEKEHRND